MTESEGDQVAGDILELVPSRVRQLGRRTVHRFGIDVTRNPFPRRLVRLCASAGVDAIVDVGANAGQYARMVRAAAFSGRIVSCEPLSEPYGELVRASSDDPGWQTVRTALGAQTGAIKVNIAGNSYSSSILDMLDAHLAAAPDSGYVDAEEVPLTTADDIFTRFELSPEHTLLKIDVQGFEQAVLEGAERVLPWLAAVQVELSLTPLYAGQQLMPEIVRHLARYGLELWAIEPGFSDPATGRMLQCDGVFVRG